MAKKTPEINASSTADIAFLLLTFFLMTTSMNVDSGLFRRLPPYQPDVEQNPPKYAKRNILQVLVNRNNQLAINGEIADVPLIFRASEVRFVDSADSLVSQSFVPVSSIMNDDPADPFAGMPSSNSEFDNTEF